ncbi:M20/M25/M40 family metallo-hydrolase [Dokdonella sp.]|uniref:M20/M25/M40 family metallo-hydrolase n=1 Tax=Dokdonella sp. TaxID=2291710 RepID=UPI0025BF1ADC|nr:M20/M25/M40 family metallo-hydrolase [Dokdonella sp.]
MALANGRSDVSAELFTACGDCGGQPSVILTIQGTTLPNEVVVLGGHLDSINHVDNLPPATERAPGADDDASGIASLTEILRVAMASNFRPQRTVKFMGYAAEEVGLNGSQAIAQSFQADGVNVVGALQLDMTNLPRARPGRDRGDQRLHQLNLECVHGPVVRCLPGTTGHESRQQPVRVCLFGSRILDIVWLSVVVPVRGWRHGARFQSDPQHE